MNEQPNFLDLPLVVPSTRSVSPSEHRRLSAQNRNILERLLEGPVTNRVLSGMALNYKARISELRQAGYDVICFDRNHTTGLSWYRLEVR